MVKTRKISQNPGDYAQGTIERAAASAGQSRGPHLVGHHLRRIFAKTADAVSARDKKIVTDSLNFLVEVASQTDLDPEYDIPDNIRTLCDKRDLPPASSAFQRVVTAGYNTQSRGWLRNYGSALAEFAEEYDLDIDPRFWSYAETTPKLSGASLKQL